MKRLLALVVLLVFIPIPGPTGGIHVKTFLSPDNSFQTITSLISNASNTIYLAVYSFSNPWLLKALDDAVARGVHVYVLLEDKHVTYFEDKYTLYAAYNLTQAGAQVHRAQGFAYMHAKYLVIDNETVMVFTGNFAKTSVPYDPSYGNRERGVVIYDVSTAKFFASIFLQDFNNGLPYDESQGTGSSVSDYVDHGSYPHPFATMDAYVERIVPFVLPNDTIVDTYVGLINSANESIEVEIAYADFRRDSIDDVNPLIKALIDAASRGVNVRVIIGFYSDEQASLALYLRQHGVWVAWGPTDTNANSLPVEDYFAAIHTKTMIIDGKIVVISSANRSDNAFHNNREAGVIIRSTDVADYYLQAFQRDREHSLIKPPIESQDYLTVNVLTPSNGSVIEVPEVSVAVNSSLTGTLSIYLNNTLVDSVNFTYGYHVFNFTLNMSSGVYVLEAKAVAGNLVASSSVTFRYYSESEGTTESTTSTQIDRKNLAIIVILAIVLRYLKKKKR